MIPGRRAWHKDRVTPDALLGQRATLTLRRFAPAGAFLALDDDPEGATLLLPEREVPQGARVGSEVAVFVHLDSEERPIATTKEPKLALGEVAFLEVTDVSHIGAFVDWGLGKELLIPFAEQAHELHVGDKEPVGLYLDRSGRLAGTTWVSDLLGGDRRKLVLDEWVDGEAWRNDPEIGLFVILEKTYVGLVPASEPHRLRRGQAAKFRVAHLLPDGKVVLSLRQHGYKEMEGDAEHVLAMLKLPGTPRLGDRSDPDQIRDVFGLSKKAFKRAIGRLLKERQIELAPDGTVTVVRDPDVKPAPDARTAAASAPASRPAPSPRTTDDARRDPPPRTTDDARRGPPARPSSPGRPPRR